jgi:hypothetical protein
MRETAAEQTFTPMGRFFVASYDSMRAKTPALEAVSPNRDIGPWISAGPTPGYEDSQQPLHRNENMLGEQMTVTLLP